jgi:hypothetical protein
MEVAGAGVAELEAAGSGGTEMLASSRRRGSGEAEVGTAMLAQGSWRLMAGLEALRRRTGRSVVLVRLCGFRGRRERIRKEREKERRRENEKKT